MRAIPTTIEIQQALEADFRSRLNLSDDDLKKVLTAFTGVLGAQFKLLNLFLSDIQNNIFPDTADLEVNGGTLERLGRIYLGRNPNPSTVGVFEFEVTGEIGAILRSGLTFKSNEDALNAGQLYILDTEYTIAAGTNIIEVRALGNGTEYALNVNDRLTITEPVIGVDQTTTVSSVLTNPTAAETTENYRQAILDSIQLEPQGGAKTDYRIWAADASGVRRVYPYVRQNNAGIVDVYVEATQADSTDGNGTPTATILQDVKDVIEFDPDETKPLNERGRRPIQAIVQTISISLIPVDVQIIGLQENSASITQAIQTNLETYLRNVRPYIAGSDLARNKNDILYSAQLQSVVTDVLEPTNFFQSFVMSVNGVVVTSSQFTLGNIPYLRNLTFSS